MVKSAEFPNKKECDRVVFTKIKKYLDSIIQKEPSIVIQKEPSVVIQKEPSVVIQSNHPDASKTSQIAIEKMITGEELNLTVDMKNLVYVIVDIENISKQDQLSQLNLIKIPDKVVKILKIAGFCSTVTNHANIIVRSNRKDAVDHYISYIVGQLESRDIKPKIYVVSRDKFGSCLQDFCNNVTHCANVSDLIQLLTM
jgi:hypothetical protein